MHALREVDLSVQGGELVAVMGPSGSGKSTLLTIAGSLEEPTSAEVLADGSELSGMSRTQRARLRRSEYRVVFRADESKHLIVVHRIDHRREVYRPR